MEIKLGGHTYTTGKLDAVKQLHVARRVLPFMLQVGLSYSTLKEILAGGANEEAMVKVVTPAIDALSKMTDEDVNYILDTVLKVCNRRTDDGTAYTPVWVQGALAYADVTLPMMLQLVGAALKENLSGFFVA